MKLTQFSNFAQKVSFSSFRILLVLLVCALSFSACNDDDDDKDDDMTPEKNIAQLVMDTDNLSSLEAALEKAGLVSTFQGSTEYTVFAPTNAAFETFLSSAGYTLESVPTDLLTTVLQRHVVAGEVKSSALSNGQMVNTIGSDTLTVNITGSTVKINNATVTQADVDASNGVVHIVDQVIQ